MLLSRKYGDCLTGMLSLVNLTFVAQRPTQASRDGLLLWEASLRKFQISVRQEFKFHLVPQLDEIFHIETSCRDL
jgi:hypothetical protein